MTSIYLVRHAQAEGNLAKRFQGHTDTPLTPLGLEQARLVGERFSATSLDAVYTSPLTRTRQTAEAIAKAHGLTPIIEPGLIEIHGGGMEDLSFEELSQRYPVEFEQFDRYPHLFQGIDGGESVLSVYERMVATVGQIVKRHPEETVVLVTHGCAIRCYLCFARAFPLERLGETDWGGNTGVSHVTYHNGKVLLHRANDITHLEGAPRPPVPPDEEQVDPQGEAL